MPLNRQPAKSNTKIEIYDPVGDINEKFDFYIKIVIGILVVAFITLLIMVGTLLVDSLHFNSVTYKEYSERIEAIQEMRGANKLLLEQNKQNQETITNQQKQILELLKKN